MSSLRMLVGLLVTIGVVVAGVFVLTVTDDTDTPPSSPDSAPASTTTAVPGSTARIPTVDIFGRRLETPAEEAGEVLPQSAQDRIESTRDDYLTAPPARLQWQRIWTGAAVPVSGSDGPTRIQDGLAEGFAHTPQGAALAAMDAIGRVYAAPEPIWRRVVTERFHVGGEALIGRFARSREEFARYVTVPEGVRIQPGYRDDLAVVELVVRSRTGYVVATWPMVWVDGDWRIRVPDAVEDLWRPATPVATTSGFGVWRYQ